jgi:Putative DNA-binding domain
MKQTEIRWSRRDEVLYLPDLATYREWKGTKYLDDGTVAVNSQSSNQAIGRLSMLTTVTLGSLRSALGAAARHFCPLVGDHTSSEVQTSEAHGDEPDDLFSITWAAYDDDEFDADQDSTAPHEIVLTSDGLLVMRTILASDPQVSEAGKNPEFYGMEPEEVQPWPVGEAVAREWLSNRGLRLTHFAPSGTIARFGDLWQASIELKTRGWTIGDAEAIGSGLVALMERISPTGQLDADAIMSLLRAGCAESLVGLCEGPALEAKAALRHGNPTDDLEIAKDISAFANSDIDGVLVYGLGTKKRGADDVIYKVHPFSADGKARAIRKIVDRYVVPPIEGMQVVVTPVRDSGEHLVVVHVPRQPPELQPFLVKGGLVAGKVNGNLVAVYRRRGDEVVASSAEGLHAMIVAGRAFLRGSN